MQQILKEVSAARVREVFDYSPETGALRWKVCLNSRAPVGHEAGCISAGYRKVRLDGRMYMAHRLIWLFVHGRWPLDQLDHINGDRQDNRISNLRECSAQENAQNLAAKSNMPGASWHAKEGRWRAALRVNCRSVHVGYFDSQKAASDAYLAAKAKHHKFQPTPREGS